jgi:hypothetical protein
MDGEMKSYTFYEPEVGNPITHTEDEIIQIFWDYYVKQMEFVGRREEISREGCILSYCSVHWAVLDK